MESCKRLEQEGFEIAYVSPRQDGVVHTEDILAEVNDNTVLVSVMYVNNETGAIMPVAEIFDAVKGKKSDIICHTDAVQAFGKIAVNPKKLGADLVSVSAHKVHSPKGCGAIYIKKRCATCTEDLRRRTGKENPTGYRTVAVDCGIRSCL